MKNSMSTLFSIFMIVLGVLAIVWVSSSTVGPARSQQNQPGPAAPGAPNSKPNPTPSAPTMDIPPPEAQSLIPGETPAPGASPAPTEAYIPGFQNSEGYTYDPTGRRDPFRPFGLTVAPKPGPSAPITSPNVKPIPVSPAEPLQQFDLAQLKVVGIVWEVRNPKAMIRDPLGKLHMVKREAKIGRNNGFVAAIREGEVVVVEPSVSETGMPTASTRVMILVR